MKSLLLTLVFISSNLWAMCNFPHNPAVYCLKANVNNIKKYTKSKNFKCVADIEIIDIYRPKATYQYNKDLNLVTFDKVSKLNKKSFKNKIIYSKKCSDLNNTTNFLVTLSCYDTYSEFKDYTFLNQSKLKDKIYDPWKQIYVDIDCSFLGDPNA